MKAPSLAIVLGHGGMHGHDGEEMDGEESDASQAEQDAYDAFEEAMKAGDKEAGLSALKTLMKLCYEGEEEEGDGEEPEKY